MKTNLSLTTADIVVIVLLIILMIIAVRIVIGFFKEKDKDQKD